MEEQNKNTIEEKKEEETKKEEELKEKIDEKKEELKEKEKKQKKEEKTKTKKNEAIVNGNNLPISLKHAVAICRMIKGKNIDYAIKMLEEVIKYKRAVPMKGEIPHRKGKMMSGRYPIKASKIILKLLKGLKANAIYNEIEIEKYKVHGIPNLASRPYRRFGEGRKKRCHVCLKLIPIQTKK